MAVTMNRFRRGIAGLIRARPVLAALFFLVQLHHPSLAQQADTAPQVPSPQVNLLKQLDQDRIILRRTSYNYAPSIIHDAELYHLYWCGGVAGDFILHAQAASLAGPWHAASSDKPSSFDVALSPTKSPRDFDGLHTCDPNVIKVGSTYFLYYSGEASEGVLTAVGVAASPDGVHFTRQNDGVPIVTASLTNPAYAKTHLTYGAGQPAAVFVAPYVYLSFTDSTAAGANKGNGAGQIAIRSVDPRFKTGVQERTQQGWQARDPGHHTGEYAFLESFGLDWGYDKQTGMIVAVSDRTAKRASLYFLDPTSLATRATADLALSWHEGPALLTEADKSLAYRTSCETLTASVLAAEGDSDSPGSWNALAYSRAEFSVGPLCKR
jgi:hypothetical protein